MHSTETDRAAGIARLPRNACVGGLHGGAMGFFLAAVARREGALLVLVADARRLDAVRLDLDAFLPAPSLPFAPWPRLEAPGPPDPDVLASRVRVLEALAALREPGRARGRAPTVVVTSLAAILQPVPRPEDLDRAWLDLVAGASHPLPGLLEHLALSGLVRVGAVETPGEFAARGGVVDLWPPGAPTAVRLDFLGDLLESIRLLDPSTQRSGRERARVRLLALAPERVRAPEAEGGVLLADHLPAGARVVRVEPDDLRDALERLDPARGTGDALRALEGALAARPTLDAFSLPQGARADRDLDVGGVDALRAVALRALAARPAAASEAPRGSSSPAAPGASSAEAATPVAAPSPERTERIADAFRDLGRRARRIVIHCRAPGEEQRLRELFRAEGPGVPVSFRRGALSRSFRFLPAGVAHVAYDDLVDLPVRERLLTGAGVRSRPIQDFLELQTGHPVVHLQHGIGIFRGLVRLDGRDGPGEFLAVEFAEGTQVYVPVARIDLVQRYVGTGRAPRLSRLGGPEWARRKEKVAAAVEELAEELLLVQARRRRRLASPLPQDGEWQGEFEASFPYPDTPDQASATRAVKQDLESDRPMDRLLCGDVGYGKTEVALRAIFKVVSAGRQAAVLVPTKVLAEQHVRTFTQRLAPYPIRVRPLSSLHEGPANRETLAGLAAGTVDVVVGTHRLLGRDVSFRDLGLVVVDEEQRFGVKHKERLKSMRVEVDVLTLSATPIPRTLHMALLGIRDISNLTTPPLGRHPIETIVAREDDRLLAEAIRRELDRGGQVYVVSSRIRDLPLVERRILEHVPEARLVSIHGQMEKERIEARMLRFVRGEADVMLATTIIESGLDIPNANTIVIRDADRYGLAEMHQLRGRVGRERRRAHAHLLLPPDRSVRPEAAERLRAIEEYTELGAGFRIAMRDLEIRGAGNLLGPQQSGHIAAVGYDLYCRLLAESVRRVRGERAPAGEPAYLAVDLPAGIPSAWVPDEREKFRLLRRASAAGRTADLDDLAEEMAERFGPLPPEVGRLLLAQRVRLVAGGLGIRRVEPAERPGLVLRAPGDGRALDRLARQGLRLVRLDPESAFLPLPGASGPEGVLRAALVRFQALEGAGS